jgi:hypothetical protein
VYNNTGTILVYINTGKILVYNNTGTILVYNNTGTALVYNNTSTITNTKGAFKNGQSRENIGYTRRRKTQDK